MGSWGCVPGAVPRTPHGPRRPCTAGAARPRSGPLRRPPYIINGLGARQARGNPPRAPFGIFMATTDPAVRSIPESAHRTANEFSIQVATVNGSGSQTANLILIRSLFQMGIPVSGKNLFPSNIAGLPTWYTIRANKDGYVGRKKEIDFLVAMNVETAREDVLSLESGAAVLYDEPLKLSALRTDLVFYPVPFDKIVADVCHDAKLRRLVKNMIYDGVLSKLLEVDLAEMEHALKRQLGKKIKAIELNMA